VIGSYSFGDPGNIGGEAPVVYSYESSVSEKFSNKAIVKQVSSKSKGAKDYAPEVGICQYLDETYPSTAPHFLYAYNARLFSVPMLKSLYKSLVEKHSVDAFILIDGGTDSLMRGDESGLGDPIEDAVSVATVASLEGLKAKILISIGFGSDRFNDVSDAASLRAVAELTKMGGFLGSVAVELNSPGHKSYKNCVEKIYSNQTFRSVLTGMVLASTRGHFGYETPEEIGYRGKQGRSFVWPLMCMLFSFDVDIVANRSYIVNWIKDEKTTDGCYGALYKGRKTVQVQGEENLPTHAEMKY